MDKQKRSKSKSRKVSRQASPSCSVTEPAEASLLCYKYSISSLLRQGQLMEVGRLTDVERRIVERLEQVLKQGNDMALTHSPGEQLGHYSGNLKILICEIEADTPTARRGTWQG